MFAQNSRYAAIQDEQLTRSDGTQLNYKGRRFLPQTKGMQIIQLVTVVAGDRIDLIASRTIGDPELFWRVCDASDAMYPLALTTQPGRSLNIPMPGS
jgi:hypothetical protein